MQQFHFFNIFANRKYYFLQKLIHEFIFYLF